MASESTAVSLPGRTQHLAEHSPPSSPARAPGAKRSGLCSSKEQQTPQLLGLLGWDHPYQSTGKVELPTLAGSKLPGEKAGIGRTGL